MKLGFRELPTTETPPTTEAPPESTTVPPTTLPPDGDGGDG